MKNKFLILIFLFSFLFFYQLSFSYSTHNTHPILTEEIVKFFNTKSQNYKFSREEIELLKEGSIREDEPAKGAALSYANTALNYQGSPINLSNVRFSNNNLGVQADGGSMVQSVDGATIEFINNTATTSPAGLW